LFEDQPESDSRSRKDACGPERPKEMERTRKVAKQESDRNEIKEDAEGARDPVMGSAALAVDVPDWNFADRCAIPRRQGGDEPMQLAVERHLVDDLSPVSLKRGAEVVYIDTAQLGHQPIRTPGRDAPHHKIVDALLAPSTDNVVALSD